MLRPLHRRITTRARSCGRRASRRSRPATGPKHTSYYRTRSRCRRTRTVLAYNRGSIDRAICTTLVCTVQVTYLGIPAPRLVYQRWYFFYIISKMISTCMHYAGIIVHTMDSIVPKYTPPTHLLSFLLPPPLPLRFGARVCCRAEQIRAGGHRRQRRGRAGWVGRVPDCRPLPLRHTVRLPLASCTAVGGDRCSAPAGAQSDARWATPFFGPVR